MRGYPHFQNHLQLKDAVLGFVEHSRNNGLNIGITEAMEALKVADDPALSDKSYFHDALKAILCTSKDDFSVFDSLFESYWSIGSGLVKSKTTYKNRSNLQKQSPGSLVMMGEGKGEGDRETDTKSVSGANAVERLRKTDFSKLAEADVELLEELALRLWKQMSLRMKRRMKSAVKGHKLDLRNTIRRNIQHGGDLIELRMRNRKPRKHRLIVLLDVSGSMDKYSYFLLRFVWSLRAHFESIEAFVFSTTLIRITDYLDVNNLEQTLQLMSLKANNWSSGTRIGACFATFNEQHSKTVLNGSSTVIVLSDGLDTGEPTELSKELKRIHMRTKKLIWLNPLKGMKEYQPVQKGMSAALDEVDLFRSAHNLDSLLELENYLSTI